MYVSAWIACIIMAVGKRALLLCGSDTKFAGLRKGIVIMMNKHGGDIYGYPGVMDFLSEY